MWIRDREIMTREDNTITIKMLNHPRCVSLFIKTLQKCLLEQYRDIHIVLQPSVAYPNACVPISGIIQYYIRNGIQFTFEYHENTYLIKCAFEQPYSYSDEDDLENAYAFPLDKIFVFNSSRQTAKLSQAYTDIISKQCECEEGVLDSINWCVAEVILLGGGSGFHSLVDGRSVIDFLHRAFEHGNVEVIVGHIFPLGIC